MRFAVEPDGPIEKIVAAHVKNCEEILRAIVYGSGDNREGSQAEPSYLKIEGVKEYQRYIFKKFCDIISIPPFDYISKTEADWLIIGDHRREIEARIKIVIERHGIGVGMLVLHAHQMRWGHIPLEVKIGGDAQNLAVKTERLHGRSGENIIFIPVRAYRSHYDKLAEMNVAKPKNLLDKSRIISHERDGNPCYYCSAPEMNPSEVIVHVEGSRLGLSRNYGFGFTFAPFGNPLTVVHFLAWDYAKNPLNMSRTPMTESDLVRLTSEINLSIIKFFIGTGINEYPTIDGVSNGWAGFTIYHQHFQFFWPEYPPPIINSDFLRSDPLVARDDMAIHRLSWETPIYRISADDAVTAGLIGNSLTSIWWQLGPERVPYKKPSKDGTTTSEKGGPEMVPAHTSNLYIPGKEMGKVLYLLLRDCRCIEFCPRDCDFVNEEEGRSAQRKDSIGVLEATGTMIVDVRESFDKMRPWFPNDITRQIDLMARAIHPEKERVAMFEIHAKELLPR